MVRATARFGTVLLCLAGCSSAPPSPEASVAFRAVGQEPGWLLDIEPAKHMRFSYDYGEKEVFTPVPDPRSSAGRMEYHAVTEAHDLRVLIEDQPCSDVMSGKPYATTVTVTLDGRMFRGCGGAKP